MYMHHLLTRKHVDKKPKAFTLKKPHGSTQYDKAMDYLYTQMDRKTPRGKNKHKFLPLILHLSLTHTFIYTSCGSRASSLRAVISQSYCQHSLSVSDKLQIPDTTTDDSFTVEPQGESASQHTQTTHARRSVFLFSSSKSLSPSPRSPWGLWERQLPIKIA